MTIRTKTAENITVWTEAFFWRAWIAAALTAVLASPVGCLMIWKKTAFFSDALSHSALAGVLLGTALGIGQNAGVVMIVCVLALLLSRISDRFPVGTDVLLLIVGQTALCAGLVGLAYNENLRTDLLGYLFGDVLSVTNKDLYFTAICAVICLALLLPNWKKQVFIAVNPDMAQSEGISLRVQSVLFMLITALFVALSLKTTGMLLVSALLIIPPAAARFLTRTPEQMAVGGILIGLAAVSFGLFVSVTFDAPAAPSIELCCAALFVFALLCEHCHKKII